MATTTTITAPEPLGLLHYDTACRELAEAHSKDEVAQVLDKVIAQQLRYKQAKNKVPEWQFTELRLRAERELGQYELEKEKQAGARGIGQGKGAEKKRVELQSATPLPQLLSERGLDKMDSFLYQHSARLPQETFDSLMKCRPPSTRALLKLAKVKMGENFSAETEWKGMPECDQKDLTASHSGSLILHYQCTPEFLADLTRFLSKTITPKTRFAHYPPVEIGHCADKQYVNKSGEKKGRILNIQFLL